MKVIGLTGGISSGKSTVSQFLAELGAGRERDDSPRRSGSTLHLSVTLPPTVRLGRGLGKGSSPTPIAPTLVEPRPAGSGARSGGSGAVIPPTVHEPAGSASEPCWGPPARPPEPTIPLDEQGETYELRRPQDLLPFFERCADLEAFETILWIISGLPSDVRAWLGNHVVYWAGIAHRGLGDRLLAQTEGVHGGPTQKLDA